MPRFSTAIDVDGERVECSIPKGTKAQRLANSVFCPLGPAHTSAWLVLTKRSVDALGANDQHTITWQHIETDDDPEEATQTTRTLTFPGLYIVRAERLLHGGVDDPNALYLVEFADSRYLAARKSDSGNIKANLLSFANDTLYLPESAGATWASLAQTLWTSVGALGGFFGMPAGLPLDGVPQNMRFIGLNAYRSLNAYLDQIDCALRHDPTANLYSIVQLGGTQDIPEEEGSLQWDAQPVNPAASRAAANIRVCFFSHEKNYGQERDTELNNNWAYEGTGHSITEETGIEGAQGTVALWDDLRQLRGGSVSNSSELNTRVQNRKARYVARWSVECEHRIHWGLLNTILPGGKVRAVLWRNWDDGKDSPLGGTVTEFICQPELVTGLGGSQGEGPAWLDPHLAAPEREGFTAPDYSRQTFPNYPRLPNMVQVWSEDAEVGETIEPYGIVPGGIGIPDFQRFHRGRVVRYRETGLRFSEDCWILFTDDYLNKVGNVKAVNGHVYGPARLSGLGLAGPNVAPDGSHETLPLYVLRKGGGEDDSGVIVFELYETLEYSGSAQATKMVLGAGGYESPPGGPDITVVDPYENPGEWEGLAGYRGMAKKREDEDDIYDVIWMERPALFTRATLTAKFVSPGQGVAINTGSATFFQQGEKAPPAVEVFDPQELYPLALSGGKTFSTWNPRTGSLETIVTQQQGIYASAKLNQELKATDTEDVEITGFRIQSFSPFNLAPSPEVTKVHNPLHLQGDNGKDIILLWAHFLGKWIILQTDHDQSQYEFVTIDPEVPASLHSGDIAPDQFNGRIIRGAPGEVFAKSRECIIEFCDYSSIADFKYVAKYGRVYGPAKWIGMNGGTPVFRCTIGEQEWRGKRASTVEKNGEGTFTLWSEGIATSVTQNAKCEFNKYEANKFAIIRVLDGELIANQVEC